MLPDGPGRDVEHATRLLYAIDEPRALRVAALGRLLYLVACFGALMLLAFLETVAGRQDAVTNLLPAKDLGREGPYRHHRGRRWQR